MNLEHLIYALRSTKDTEVREQITLQYPPDWEMEAVFRKSYQTYLQTAGKSAPLCQTRHKAVYRAVTAAACLLLSVGLGVGIWSKQQRIESRPPQETASVTQTETSTETTAQTQYTTASSTRTASQTTAAVTQTRTETTASPMTERVQEPAVIVPETPTQTTAPQITGTESAAASETVRPSETVQTESSEMPPDTATTPPPLEGSMGGGVPPSETTATAPVFGDGSYPGEPGFHTADGGDHWTITPVCTGDEPENFEMAYQITGGRYRIESVETDQSGSQSFRSYQLYDSELGRYWLLSQFPMKGFSQEIYWSDGTVQIADLQDVLPVMNVSGFVVTYTFSSQMPEYTVCWTDGNYVMFMSGSDSRLLTLDLPEQFRTE